MSQENVKAVRGLYEAFNSGDLEAFEKGCAREILWMEPENSVYAAGNPYRSFVAIRDGVFRTIERDYAGFRCEVDKLLDAGDFVIGTGRYRGRHKGTGKDTSAQFCHIVHLDRAGKLDWAQLYTDTLQEAEVAGLIQRTAQPAAQPKVPEPAM